MKGIFLDTETNGLNPKRHHIIEIAYKVVDLMTGDLLDAYYALLSYPFEIWKQSDKESLQVTGFSWEETTKGKKEETVVEEIKQSFKKNNLKRSEAVFICQNPSFDRTFVSKLIDVDVQEAYLWPYHWLDLASMHFAMSLLKARDLMGPFPWKIGFSKDQIAQFHKLPLEAKPHRAMNGVDHLLLCYETIIGFPNRLLA